MPHFFNLMGQKDWERLALRPELQHVLKKTIAMNSMMKTDTKIH